MSKRTANDDIGDDSYLEKRAKLDNEESEGMSSERDSSTQFLVETLDTTNDEEVDAAFFGFVEECEIDFQAKGTQSDIDKTLAQQKGAALVELTSKYDGDGEIVETPGPSSTSRNEITDSIDHCIQDLPQTNERIIVGEFDDETDEELDAMFIKILEENSY